MSEMTARKAKSSAKIIINFPEGMYGFEDVHEYILLQEDEAKTIWSLQAAYKDVPSFVVVNPFMLMKDYSPILSDEDLKALGMPNEEEIVFLAVTALKDTIEESVVNLKSPIVINVRTKLAKQIILENNNYPIRCQLFPNLK